MLIQENGGKTEYPIPASPQSLVVVSDQVCFSLLWELCERKFLEYSFSVSGKCADSVMICCHLFVFCRTDLLHNRSAGISPSHGYLSSCSWCRPGLLLGQACRFWTKSDGHSRVPLHNLMISGSSLPLDL